MAGRFLSWLAAAMLVVAGTSLAFADSAPQVPANVQAIIKKIGQGIPPTAAEKKTLSDWQSRAAKSMGGGAAGGGSGGGGSGGAASGLVGGSPGGGRPAASKVAGYFSVGVSSAANNPCHPAGKAVGLNTTPSKAAYLATAKDALNTYQAHLTASAQASLNSALGQVPVAGYGAAMAPVFVLHGNGSAAVAAAAYSAQKDASDITTASNLGAILRGMHDYARAAIALKYAQSLAPKNAIVANNLGWLAFGQGDVKTATGLFKTAVQNNGKLGAAQLGQGLAALCSGQPAQALTPLRAAIADDDYSDVVADAVYSADEDLADSGNASADTASPNVYSNNSQGGGGGGVAEPNWQEPPFPQDPAKFAAMKTIMPNPVVDYIDTYLQNRKMAAVKIMQSAKGSPPSSSGSAQTIVFKRGSSRQAFEISDIQGIMSRQTKPLLNQWDQYLKDSMQRDGCRGCFGGQQPNPPCSGQAAYKNIHSQVVGTEHQDWQALHKNIDDLYGFAGPLISQIQDQSVAWSEEASLELWSDDQIMFFAGSIPQWEQEAYMAYEPNYCVKIPEAPMKLGGTLPTFSDDPTKCKSGSVYMHMGFANLSADCTELTLTIGEGLVGALDWKFAPDYTKMADGSLRATGTDWSQDQVTIMIGAGGGTSGPASANAQVGGYITVQGGSVTDTGGVASVGGTVGSAGDLDTGATGTESPAQVGETITGKVGVVSGPDVSMSGSARVGGTCGSSC